MEMRIAKASEKDTDTLRIWLQFNDELSKINTESETSWARFKSDWEDDDDFIKIINKIDSSGEFSLENYFDYYSNYISHIHSRILFGYVTLLDNCCDPDLSYLAFNKDIVEALEKNQKD